VPRIVTACCQPEVKEEAGEGPPPRRGATQRPVRISEGLNCTARRLWRHMLAYMAKDKYNHCPNSFSSVEIMTTLFCQVMRHDPTKPERSDSDRFVLSYFRSPALLYAALTVSGHLGGEDWLLAARDSSKPGHLGLREIATWASSPGQSLSIANGLALAARLSGRKYRVYALLDEQECLEGQVWEAALAAAHHRLDNVTAVVDLPRKNKGMERSLVRRWRSFGWQASMVDGHDFTALLQAFLRVEKTRGSPSAIVALTEPGRGAKFLESCHNGSGRDADAQEMAQLLEELP